MHRRKSITCRIDRITVNSSNNTSNNNESLEEKKTHYQRGLIKCDAATWAGLDPASPAQSLAQASDPAGPYKARVI
jgi:hypothetical protein